MKVDMFDRPVGSILQVYAEDLNEVTYWLQNSSIAVSKMYRPPHNRTTLSYDAGSFSNGRLTVTQDARKRFPVNVWKLGVVHVSQHCF